MFSPKAAARVDGTAEPTIDDQALQLTVIFTTLQGTLAALKKAGHLAHQLRAKIRIIVPQVVPYPLPLNQPPVDPHFKIRKFSTLCCKSEVDTRIEVRLCRDAKECVEKALSPESIVLLGGRERLLPTWPQRLAKRLNRANHHVIFVQA